MLTKTEIYLVDVYSVTFILYMRAAKLERGRYSASGGCCSMAWGGERGVVVVDVSRRAVVAALAAAALYGPLDPWARLPHERREPSLDQVSRPSAPRAPRPACRPLLSFICELCSVVRSRLPPPGRPRAPRRPLSPSTTPRP